MKSIAIDLGASSGRVIVGEIEKNRVILTEVYRFSNSGQESDKGLVWDISVIFQEILKGLNQAAEQFGSDFDSLAVDSWGLDYVLLNSDKKIILEPFHYRNTRTRNSQSRIEEILPKQTLFSTTGIQFMEINTLNQLYASNRDYPDETSSAEHFLMVSDYITFLLTGIIINECTNASTTQLLHVHTNQWAYELIEKLELPSRIFHPLTMPGTKIGTLLKTVAQKTGLQTNTTVIATASHDTAAAVAAVPCEMTIFNPGEWVYISSGTWSLIGVELNSPIVEPIALKHNFTNEKGVQKTVRFLKNITGMWIIQECKKYWNIDNPNLTWDEINSQAEQADSLNRIIDVNHPDFLNPQNMLETVIDKIEIPSKMLSIGQITRTIYESMAYKYHEVIHQIEKITKIKPKIIYIVGGGSKVSILNQLLANKTQLPVVCGPSEATALGNLLIQAMAMEKVKDLTTIRNLIRASFTLDQYDVQS
ncbi:MAG: rhamnulokinase [Candidatus Lokiarchaeota archaeon]|nr:rhamnulokinase [Candidatus Lokiarchaeota archaeon]